MKPSKTRFLIFVRPVGSLRWTQHVKQTGVPYVSFSEEQAFDDACKIAEGQRWCAHVAKVDLRQEPDEALRATASDLDATYFLPHTDK